MLVCGPTKDKLRMGSTDRPDDPKMMYIDRSWTSSIAHFSDTLGNGQKRSSACVPEFAHSLRSFHYHSFCIKTIPSHHKSDEQRALDLDQRRGTLHDLLTWSTSSLQINDHSPFSKKETSIILLVDAALTAAPF